MTTCHRPSPLRFWVLSLALAAGMALSPDMVRAEGGLSVSSGQSANSSSGSSAALQFRVVIPPVMRVLENSHPSQLEAAVDGSLVGQQRLVIASNMKHGFCVALRLNQPRSGEWQLQTIEANGTSLAPTAEGFRLCVSRPGRHTLLLQHSFKPTTTNTAIAWPVQTDITAL